jgi:hypothetical protein
MKKLTTLALALAVGMAGAMVATGADAKSKPKAKAPGPETRMAACKKTAGNIYTADQRVMTYGYCVQGLNYYGTNNGYATSAGYGRR